MRTGVLRAGVPRQRLLHGLRLRTLAVAVGTGVALVVGFAAAEAWIRLTKPYVTPDTEREASLQYEVSLFSRHILPRSRQRLRAPDGHLQATVNRLGYRGADFALQKPPGRLRVVVLGGSAVFDLAVREGHDWPHLLERHLVRAGLPDVEVVNAGVPGHATWDMLGRAYAELWMLEPDVVVVYEAWNDLKYFSWLEPAQPLLRGVRPLPTVPGTLFVQNPFLYYSGSLDRFLSGSQLYVRLRRRYWWWRTGEIGLEGVIAGPGRPSSHGQAYPSTYPGWGVRQYELNLRTLAGAVRAMGARPVFVTQARLVSRANGPAERSRIAYDYVRLSHEGLLRAFEDCDRAMGRAARAEAVPLLDAGRLLSGRSALFTDHVHLQPAGSKALARAVSEFLHPLLAPVRSASGHPTQRSNEENHG